MLSARQETVLKLIVDDYIQTASPVASESIVRKYDLGVSSATIRNDVAELEDAGFINRPHTSAGSVPGDKAYRFYVEKVAVTEPDNLSQQVKQSVRDQLNEIERDVDAWSNVAAGLVAQIVGNMAVATAPRVKESRVKHLELVYLQEFLAMFIVVLEQARLRRQIIRLSEPFELTDLEASTNRVKEKVLGLTRREIESQDLSLTPLEEELVDTTVLILKEEDKTHWKDHHVFGLRNLLAQPEFEENERVRAIVEVVEDGSLVQAILEETPTEQVVRVVIGEEHTGDILWPLSVVICRYGIPDGAMGVVGAVGPTRMEYSKTIEGVRFVSSVMGDLVESAHIG